MKYKIIKITGLLASLAMAYIVSGILLVVLTVVLSQLLRPASYLPILTSAIYSMAVIYLFAFVACYQFIYKKTKQPSILLRVLLYSLFISFSAALLFPLLDSFLQYSHFLRFRSSIGGSIDSVSPSLFFVAVASFIGYTLLTVGLELKNRVNNFIKPLIYWFFTILVGWYLSIPILIAYTGMRYQQNCIWNDWLKKTVAPEYCYAVGEPIYYHWTMMPGIIIFVIEIVFIILYFIKHNKEKEK